MIETGDAAIDFDVTDAGVRLSDHFGKRPVALIFGSYGSPAFRSRVTALNELHEQYRDAVAFYVVYHDEVRPKERGALHMQFVLDDATDSVSSAYGGSPHCLYLIGSDGLVAFHGAEPHELAAAITEALAGG